MPLPTDGQKAFLARTSISVIVPLKNRIHLAEVIDNGAGEVTLQDIQQRDTLFFDEQLLVYVVLNIPTCTAEDLKLYLSWLDLKLEVWSVTDSSIPERSATSNTTRSLLSTSVIDQKQDPIVLVNQSGHDESVYLNLIWEVPLKLNKPPIKLQAAHTVFTPVASFLPTLERYSDTDVLEPFRPQVANLFEPLKISPAFKDQVPYLPISRFDSDTSKQSRGLRIKCFSSHAILTHAAFNTRLRMSSAGAGSKNAMGMATLDIEMIPFLDLHGHLQSADPILQKGTVKHVTGEMLPMECRSRDIISLLYELQSRDNNVIHSNSTSMNELLTISIIVSLELSDVCTCKIEMQSITHIDLAPLLQLGRSASSIFPQDFVSHQRPLDESNDRQDSIQNTDLHISEMRGKSSNSIMISFSSPSAPTQVGVPFSWRILIVNCTKNVVKLAVIPLPRKHKPVSQAQQYAKRHATKSSTASAHAGENMTSDIFRSEIASAVVDENILYAMQHSSAMPPDTELMSLTPELRIGPLGSGQCHEAEIKFIAFRAGIYTLDAIRVVDLIRESEHGQVDSTMVTDVTDLPNVIIEEKKT